jgi:hypothetical protein
VVDSQPAEYTLPLVEENSLKDRRIAAALQHCGPVQAAILLPSLLCAPDPS